MAALAAFDLIVNEGMTIKEIYTFGQPRFADEAFAKTADRKFREKQIPDF